MNQEPAVLFALAAFLTNPAAQSAMVNPLGDLYESDASDSHHPFDPNVRGKR
ncbi:MAG: hypothetical protein WD226_06860 [Planctomycetota bacterium]